MFLAMAVQLPILSRVPARGNSPGSRRGRRRSTSYGLFPSDQRGVTLKELLDLQDENPEISEAVDLRFGNQYLLVVISL